MGRKIIRELQKLYTHNVLIRLALQLYTIWGFAAILNITAPAADNASDKISLTVAILCSVLFVLTPVIFSLILGWKHTIDDWRKSKVDELYRELRKDNASHLFYLVYLFRRVIIVLTPFITGIVVIQIGIAT